MPVKIAIASGKGGTGKTTVSVSLYSWFVNELGYKVKLVDCDVEEPNDRIFFEQAKLVDSEEINQLIPQFDNSKCTFCCRCLEFCEFNAISVIPKVKFTSINAGLCHSCGACLAACKENALIEQPHLIGKINTYRVGLGSGLIEGELAIGSAMQTMLIKELKKRVANNCELVIYDAPPGTSCPVVETIIDADYVILVTEPTPFGLHDLKLMFDLLKDVKKPFGVIINKSGLGDMETHQYLKDNDIHLLGEIPFSRKFASSYSKGEIMCKIKDEMALSYEDIAKKIEQRMIVYEGDNHFKR